MDVTERSEMEPDDSEILKILIATDNHLGFGEKYPERQKDSFTTFDEILQIGRDENVDLVILGAYDFGNFQNTHK